MCVCVYVCVCVVCVCVCVCSVCVGGGVVCVFVEFVMCTLCVFEGLNRPIKLCMLLG